MARRSGPPAASVAADPLASMPDELLRFSAPGQPSDADTLGAFWRWQARRNAWIEVHAPGATYREVQAERASRRPVVDAAQRASSGASVDNRGRQRATSRRD